MSENCELCKDEFEDVWVKNYAYWNLQVHTNQYYLGRSILKLKRHVVDITEMNMDEREELFNQVLPEVKNALDELFNPDLYNYASLGNSCPHLHFHVIPRYKSNRTFNGRDFVDENWDSHWKPDYEHDVSQETIQKLRENMEEHLN